MIKAVIFDLDGTVADTIDSIRHGINLTMNELGYPENSREQILSNINNGARWLVCGSLPKDKRDDKSVDEALALYDKKYEATYMEVDGTYEGIPALAETLHKKGIKLAVLSNKPDRFVKAICEKLLCAQYFSVFRGQKDGAPAKPDPTVPLELCRLMGIEPSQCAFVGDSDIDMLTAKNSGFFALGVSWGYRTEEVLRENGASAIAHHPKDIEQIILSVK